MRILFNNDLEEDVVNILAFIEGFASDFDIDSKSILIDSQKVEAIVQGVRRDFPHNDGLDNASAFKKIANFMSYFIAERPICESFKNSTLPSDVLKINNYENSIIALLIGLSALHGAEIHQNGKITHLTNPIELSKHSFVDLIDTLANITPLNHFKLLTVLLEQLAYKTNPTCQYEVKVFS